MFLKKLSVKKHLKIKATIKDMRIVMNTMSDAVKLLNKAGITAKAVQTEFDDYYEYVVKIPKRNVKST